MELSTAFDYVNQLVQQVIENRFRFEPYWLADPVDVSLQGQTYNVSWHAYTPIGEMHRNDLLLVVHEHVRDVVVGCVNRFFERDGSMIVDMSCFQPERPRVWTRWVTDTPERCMIDILSVKSMVKWARRDAKVIGVLLPSTLKLP